MCCTSRVYRKCNGLFDLRHQILKPPHYWKSGETNKQVLMALWLRISSFILSPEFSQDRRVGIPRPNSCAVCLTLLLQTYYWLQPQEKSRRTYVPTICAPIYLYISDDIELLIESSNVSIWSRQTKTCYQCLSFYRYRRGWAYNILASFTPLIRTSNLHELQKNGVARATQFKISIANIMQLYTRLSNY
jgi:hypothetical protein